MWEKSFFDSNRGRLSSHTEDTYITYILTNFGLAQLIMHQEKYAFALLYRLDCQLGQSRSTDEKVVIFRSYWSYYSTFPKAAQEMLDFLGGLRLLYFHCYDFFSCLTGRFECHIYIFSAYGILLFPCIVYHVIDVFCTLDNCFHQRTPRR